MKKIVLMLVVAFIGLTTVHAQKVQKSSEQVYNVVEQMPEYPGGMSAMSAFLGQNIRYPDNAKKKKIEGQVIVTFIIDKNGRITEPKVLRKVFPSLDTEALRVVSLMPKWAPGRIGGRPVNVKYTLPIAFRLK